MVVDKKNFLRIQDGVISAGLDVIFSQDGEYVVCYCPALDLSSYGKNHDDAHHAFEEVLSIFLEDTLHKGTLERILLDLGWFLSKQEYIPPRLPHNFLENKISGTIELASFKIPIAS
ncbi:MAG TPA: hypothetical protein VE978_07120 [Chitinophagales bacterium]|nr:hypothetical protein [Chitinophagales bacterium]